MPGGLINEGFGIQNAPQNANASVMDLTPEVQQALAAGNMDLAWSTAIKQGNANALFAGQLPSSLQWTPQSINDFYTAAQKYSPQFFTPSGATTKEAAMSGGNPVSTGTIAGYTGSTVGQHNQQYYTGKGTINNDPAAWQSLMQQALQNGGPVSIANSKAWTPTMEGHYDNTFMGNLFSDASSAAISVGQAAIQYYATQAFGPVIGAAISADMNGQPITLKGLAAGAAGSYAGSLVPGMDTGLGKLANGAVNGAVSGAVRGGVSGAINGTGFGAGAQNGALSGLAGGTVNGAIGQSGASDWLKGALGSTAGGMATSALSGLATGALGNTLRSNFGSNNMASPTGISGPQTLPALMPQAGGGTAGAAGTAGGIDWTALLNGVGSVAAPLISNGFSNTLASRQTDNAQAALFKGMGVNSPVGNSSWDPATNSYTMGYGANSPQNGLQSYLNSTLASGGPNGGPGVGALNSAGESYIGAGNSALSALGNFDPNAFASNTLSQLNALAAPGDVTETQKLMNHLQATGRIGLNQNGELGDIGQLDLSQRTAGNQRALQASQLATQQQDSLAQRANAFGSTGGNMYQGAGALATNASNAFSGLTGAFNQGNSNLLQQLQTSIMGSNAQSNAGFNYGGLMNLAAGTRAQGNANTFGNIMGQIAGPSGTGGVGNAVNNVWGALKNIFGGSTPSTGGASTGGFNFGNLFGSGGGIGGGTAGSAVLPQTGAGYSGSAPWTSIGTDPSAGIWGSNPGASLWGSNPGTAPAYTDPNAGNYVMANNTPTVDPNASPFTDMSWLNGTGG